MASAITNYMVLMILLGGVLVGIGLGQVMSISSQQSPTL